MSKPMFEPRRVAPHALRRWLRDSLWFILNSPLPMTALAVSLFAFTAVCDAAISHLSGLTLIVASTGIKILMFPVVVVLIVVVIAMARAAESGTTVRENLRALTQQGGVNNAALLMLSTGAAVHITLFVFATAIMAVTPVTPATLINTVAPLNTSDAYLAVAMTVGLYVYGPFSLPLAIVSGVSDQALLQSVNDHACRKNDCTPLVARVPATIALFVLTHVVLIIGNALSIVGTAAALTVFATLFQYAAFRDVFEHRDPPRHPSAQQGVHTA